jgi:MFS superfamily sulfate permease-like transporter
MGILLPLIFFVVCLVLLVLMRRWLQRGGAGPWMNGVFCFVVVLGSLLGSWFSLRFEYQTDAHTRVAGAPLPLVVFKLENGKWTDFPPDLPVIIGLVIANASIVSMTLAGMMVLGFTLRQLTSHKGT